MASKPTLRGLDAHEKPPEALRLLFKQLQKSTVSDLERNVDMFCSSSGGLEDESKVRRIGVLKSDTISPIFDQFIGHSGITNSFPNMRRTVFQEGRVLEATQVPGGTYHSARVTNWADSGLLIFPSLLTPEVQLVLLHKLLHRDLSNPTHQTNLHLHHHIPYLHVNGESEDHSTYGSFFSLSPETVFAPRDRSMHKDLTLKTVLNKKLRWITLGGQYDWTAKEYPDQQPPDFPADIQGFLLTLFPDIISQAAIVNFYSPGDVLSMHRDVSEQCDRGLISISIGCDGLFLVGLDDGNGLKSLTVRLRSGDVVCMTGQSRSAWHGVPKILADTCPEWLKDWPACGDSADSMDCWRGWMSGKRINVNIRQIYSD